MKKIIVAALAASAAAAVTAIPAQAADGCGRGAYRGPHGRCRAEGGRGGVVVGAPAVRLVIGNYYPDRGYWDGRRYYQHRDRWHGGWRYR